MRNGRRACRPIGKGAPKIESPIRTTPNAGMAVVHPPIPRHTVPGLPKWTLLLSLGAWGGAHPFLPIAVREVGRWDGSRATRLSDRQGGEAALAQCRPCWPRARLRHHAGMTPAIPCVSTSDLAMNTNVERFSLGGAAHWPLRGSHAVAGRAGERKTYWANPPAQLRRCPRDADADAVRLIHSAMVVNVGQWRPNERWNFRRERYNRRGYGADFANMGFVCLRLVAESKRCRQCCGAVATRG